MKIDEMSIVKTQYEKDVSRVGPFTSCQVKIRELFGYCFLLIGLSVSVQVMAAGQWHSLTSKRHQFGRKKLLVFDLQRIFVLRTGIEKTI